MLLYHISTDLSHNGFFQPDIPNCMLNLKDKEDVFLEDITTKRICAASTIEGCFSSMPHGGRDLDRLNSFQKCLFKLFIIDTEKLNIQDNRIIDGKTLCDQGLVYDANLMGEHWILDSFQVPEEDTLYITPYHWEEEVLNIPVSSFMEKRGYIGEGENFTENVCLIRHLRFFADNGKSHLNIYPGPEKNRSDFEDVFPEEWGKYHSDIVWRLQYVRESEYGTKSA